MGELVRGSGCGKLGTHPWNRGMREYSKCEHTKQRITRSEMEVGQDTVGWFGGSEPGEVSYTTVCKGKGATIATL